MILSEAHIDGINNDTVLLKQKNHDAVQKLKYNYQNLCGYRVSSDHCTIFDAGKIVDVGPGLQLDFDNGFSKSSCVLYGDVDKLKEWVNTAVEQLEKTSSKTKTAMKNLEIIEQAADFLKTGLWDNNPDTIKSMLFEFINQNTPDVTPYKTLSVWDCVGNDPKRPVLSHVYLDHVNKVAVGTDAHVIFINPDEYKKTSSVENGEVINKDYSEWEDKLVAYPDYTKFIPAGDLEDVKFVDGLADLAKKANVISTLSGNLNPSIQVIANDEKALMSTRLVTYILTAGTDGWKRLKTRPLYVKNWDGKTIVVVGNVVK